MSFLPQDYKAPKSSNNYAKILEGHNKFRILSAPILGWEDWRDNKPVRWTFDNKPAKPFDPKKPIRHFWSMIAWNYDQEQIQILHITQATIRSNIEALCADADWGSPYTYDIKIIKTGEGTNTEYMVNPLPHKPLDPSIIKAFHDKPCNLNAIFTNDDPFAEHNSYTQGMFDQSIPLGAKSNTDVVLDLDELIRECSPEFQARIAVLLKNANVKSTALLPEKTYKNVKAQAFADRDTYADLLRISKGDKVNVSETELPF